MLPAVTLALFLVVLVLWIRWRRKKLSYWKDNGIQGPPPSFWLGNMWELTKERPLEVHKRWTKKYGRVVGYYFGLRPVLLVEDPELIKEIQIRNFHKFADRPRVFDVNTKPAPVEKQNMISNRGEKWKTVRSIISPSFAINKMKMMAPIINGAVEDFMEILAKKENTEVDLAPLYKALTMDVIGRTAFGVQTQIQKNPQDPFFKAAQSLFKFTSFGVYLTALAVSFPEVGWLWMKLRDLLVRFLNRGRNPGRVLENVCKEVIQARRNDPSARRPDLLQMMVDTEMSESQLASTTAAALAAEDDQTESTAAPTENGTSAYKENVKKLTEREVVNNSILFFLAGYETTSTALAFITCLLALHPEIQEKTRRELQEVVKAEGELDYSVIQKLQYLDMMVKESLRIYPPIYLFVNREASEEFRYGNIVIPKGSNVQVPTFVLHRDPEFWEDPDTFNPERFSPENKDRINPITFQSFGGGPRNCIGMRFAQMEAKFALVRLLLKYRVKPSHGLKKDGINVQISNAIIRPENGVPVILEPLA